MNRTSLFSHCLFLLLLFYIFLTCNSVKKNPDIFWKYEDEILCLLFENEVFALEKFIEKAWYLWQSILYVSLLSDVLLL